MKNLKFILFFCFVLGMLTSVQAKEIDTTKPVEVACDYACYTAPESASGIIIDNAQEVMNTDKYVAFAIGNMAPSDSMLMVVISKDSNDVVCAYTCQDYTDEMINENISKDDPSAYKDYNENSKGKNYYKSTGIKDAYTLLAKNEMSDGDYTVYDIDNDGTKEFIYYENYDISDPSAMVAFIYHYKDSKLSEEEVDYDSNIKTILSKTKWCKMNDTSLVNETFKNDISVVLNGNELSFEQPPYIENGTTRVPMRKIFEALGATVDYNASTKTITAKKGDTSVELVAGASSAKINGKQTALSASVTNKNGSTMVPLRFVSEALGAEVAWDGTSRTITINLADK